LWEKVSFGRKYPCRVPIATIHEFLSYFLSFEPGPIALSGNAARFLCRETARSC
jgi:hypothetical protein